MPRSVLEAIKSGIWNYEPGRVATEQYPATSALPGSDEKLSILADRLQAGLPLWHPADRICYDSITEE